MWVNNVYRAHVQGAVRKAENCYNRYKSRCDNADPQNKCTGRLISRGFCCSDARHHPRAQDISRLVEMGDKIVTIRQELPLSQPVGQSFVADWANFAPATSGGGIDGGGIVRPRQYDSVEHEEGRVQGGAGDDTKDADEHENRSDSGSEDDSRKLDRSDSDTDDDSQKLDDYKDGRETSSSSGSSSSSSESGDDDSSTEDGSKKNADVLSEGPVHQSSAMGAATLTDSQCDVISQDILDSIRSVTRSTSGDSIADILERIGTSLRAIEVAATRQSEITEATTKPANKRKPAIKKRTH